MMGRWSGWLDKRAWFAAFLLVAVTLVVFAGTLANGFVYDDEQQILQNPFVLNPKLWPRIFLGSVWSFMGSQVQTNFYRPLQFFSYWLVYRLAGPNPAAFHLLLLVLYTGSVWLVFRIGREALQNQLAAFIGALLWAVHPLHVEAVAWIAALPEVGFAFFCLVALLLFLRAERSAESRMRGHMAGAAAFLPALFFKEMALAFPLLLLTYWLLAAPPERWWKRLLRWLPYLLATMLYLAARWAVLGHFTYTAQPWRLSLRTLGAALGLLGAHTRLFFWPTHLNVFRTFELGPALRSPWPWLTLLVLLALVWRRRREPLLSFLTAWWAVALLPVLDIRQLSFPLLAERFSYFPSVGLCLALSALLIMWLPRRLPSPFSQRASVVLLIAVMCFWTVQTVRAIPNWRDNETLVNHSLRQSPDAALLHAVRALILQYRHGDLDGATQEYETALRLNWASLRPLASVTYDSYLGLGQIAFRRGRREEAVAYFEKAIQVLPAHSPARNALGSVYFADRDYEGAARVFAEAVKVNPQDLGARFYLGTCWMKLGKNLEAAEQFRAAREVDPTYRQAYEAEARALAAAGKLEEAARVRTLLNGR